MKKLLLLLFFAFDTAAMTTTLNRASSFGRTHFIRGYHHSPIVQTQNIPPRKRLSQSFFGPQDNLLSKVLKIIEEAQGTIEVAAFALTDNRIANHLIDAHKRGVKVCIIMDSSNMKNNHSKSQKLINHGITVLRYEPSLRPNYKKNNYEPLMHLKWIITDDRLITGSANLTRSAQSGDNVDSITIFECPEEIKDHRQAFQNLKQFCVECKPASPVSKTKQ